jgi:hypothetical protein
VPCDVVEVGHGSKEGPSMCIRCLQELEWADLVPDGTATDLHHRLRRRAVTVLPLLWFVGLLVTFYWLGRYLGLTIRPAFW